jgi:hypothetical protein
MDKTQEELEVIKEMALKNIIKSQIVTAKGITKIENEGWDLSQVVDNLVDQSQVIPEEDWDKMIEGEIDCYTASASVSIIHQKLLELITKD